MRKSCMQSDQYETVKVSLKKEYRLQSCPSYSILISRILQNVEKKGTYAAETCNSGSVELCGNDRL